MSTTRTPELGDRRPAVVVGARCAGAATALLLARQGHRVVVIDRARFPSDTLSTHAISRGGVVQLRRWGLLDAVVESGAPPVRHVSFHVGGEVVHKTVKGRAGIDLLVAPRRHILDQILVDAAVAAGAELRTGVTVTGLRRDATGRVNGVEGRGDDGAPVAVCAGVVIGADGVRSMVATAAGARMVDVRPPAGSTHYAYYSALDGDGFEFHIGDRLLAGVFRTHGGEACVWVCSPAAAARGLRGHDRARVFEELVGRAAPALALRLGQAKRASAVRGAAGLPNHVRQAWGPGWALVGDAGYHRDPITGHGITDAFRDAELLAGALTRARGGDASEAAALSAYERQRDAWLRDVFEATCALGQFPPVKEFVLHQKRLAEAIEREAECLAALPAPTAGAVAA
jgi:2-polyprenyl-6-methoxyphenol hydroxylase-like FAD-dependent oxidoreductase